MEYLGEWAFWIASATGSVILSVIANLLTPFFNSFTRGVSKPRFRRNYEKRLRKLKRVERLESDQALRYEARLDGIQFQLNGIGLVLLSLLLLLLSSGAKPEWLLVALAIPIGILGITSLEIGNTQATLVRLAASRKRELESSGLSGESLKELRRTLNVRDFDIAGED